MGKKVKLSIEYDSELGYKTRMFFVARLGPHKGISKVSFTKALDYLSERLVELDARR